jgi:hypothetical protein
MKYKSSSGSNAPWEVLLPPVTQEVNEEYLKTFFDMMHERQEIWYRRNILKLPAPWSENEILRDYNFTHVYRELDRNSQWEIENIIKPKDITEIEKFWMICFFRLMNEPKFFEFYSKNERFKNALPTREEFNKARYFANLLNYRKTGNNPYTSAYLINTACCPNEKRDKCYAFKIIATLHKEAENVFKTLKTAKEPEEFIKHLMTLPAIAEFVSHEMYISLCYFERYSPTGAIMRWDENDFTNVGPGCSLGIRLIFPSTLAKDQRQRIHDLRDMSNEYLPDDFKYLEWDRKRGYYANKGNNISLHQIEMFCCEFSKYWKMLNKVGKQRKKYDWSKYAKK